MWTPGRQIPAQVLEATHDISSQLCLTRALEPVSLGDEISEPGLCGPPLSTLSLLKPLAGLQHGSHSAHIGERLIVERMQGLESEGSSDASRPVNHWFRWQPAVLMSLLP